MALWGFIYIELSPRLNKHSNKARINPTNVQLNPFVKFILAASHVNSIISGNKQFCIYFRLIIQNKSEQSINTMPIVVL